MALKKTIINDEGVELTYHRILGMAINFDYDDAQIQVNLISYVDEQQRTLEKETNNQLGVLINQPLLNYIDDNFSRSNLYNRLKSEDERFIDAEDV